MTAANHRLAQIPKVLSPVVTGRVRKGPSLPLRSLRPVAANIDASPDGVMQTDGRSTIEREEKLKRLDRQAWTGGNTGNTKRGGGGRRGQVVDPQSSSVASFGPA